MNALNDLSNHDKTSASVYHKTNYLTYHILERTASLYIEFATGVGVHLPNHGFRDKSHTTT